MAALVLLVAVAAGMLGQGGYYASVQRFVGVLVVVAAALAFAAWPLTRGDVRLGPVVPALALAAWAVLDAVVQGIPAAGVGSALLLVGLVVVLLVCRRLGQEDREVLLIGVIGIGLLVALTGWLGVVGRVGSWAWQAQGLWRASSTLSYPNATAAVLAVVVLLVLARLAEVPSSLPLVLAATGLLAGLAATMSRAGALALVVGVVVLAGLQGPGRLARAAVGPCAGALLALAGLVPSLPAASPPRPLLAVGGLAAGLVLAATVSRLGRWSAIALLLGGVLAGGLVALLLIGGGGTRGAVETVTEARLNLASPDRSGALHAALRTVAAHPLLGAGPGQADLRWKGQDGVTSFYDYAHNEYAQVASELGLVGLALLAVVLVALGRLLWRSRATTPSRAAWSGVVAASAAFAVHSGFDFVWHLPAILLTVLALIGVVLPAPDHADAPKPPVRAQGRESNDLQTAE